MTRLVTLLLHAALVLVSISAVTYAVRILLQQALNLGSWYWGGALAVFAGPLLIAGALKLLAASPAKVVERADA